MPSELSDRFRSVINLFKEKVFGRNNERLDFVMDSFYKLNPRQRNGVLAGIGGGIGLMILAILALYFSQVKALRDELSQSFEALNELHALKNESAREQDKFKQLTDRVKNKTSKVNFKPFFEKVSKEAKVTLENLSDKPYAMDSNSLLTKELVEHRIEMLVSNVSIPRLMNFLIKVEESKHYLRVQNIKISTIFGQKNSKFNVEVLWRGYKPAR